MLPYTPWLATMHGNAGPGGIFSSRDGRVPRTFVGRSRGGGAVRRCRRAFAAASAALARSQSYIAAGFAGACSQDHNSAAEC